jgi:hypothetical protein
MITEIIQTTADAVKTSSYVTGQFVIDGALLIGTLKVIEAIIGKIRTRRNGGSVQAKIEELEKNPKSGEGETCREHGEAISALEESKKNTYGWLARIDGKIDRLLERKG